MPGQGLGRAGRDAGALQVGDECMAVGVEIGELPGAILILVFQEVRPLPLGLLLRCLALGLH
jgi:hypothetical protein